MKDIRGKRILVIGSGLGSDADILADLNEVDVFELPGYLREFCRFRLQDRAWILDHETIFDIPKNGEYDLIVGIDVLEHIHPEEFETTMDALKRLLKSKNGSFYFHNNFKEQTPQAFDHSERFMEWQIKNGLVIRSATTGMDINDA